MNKNLFKVRTSSKLVLKNEIHSPKSPKKTTSSCSIAEESYYNIWKPNETNESSCEINSFLQLYKHRFLCFLEQEEGADAEKVKNIEIIQNVYKLIGDRTFGLENWKEFVNDIPINLKQTTKKIGKISVFGLINAVKHGKPWIDSGKTRIDSGKTRIDSPERIKSPKSPTSPKKFCEKMKGFEVVEEKKGIRLPLINRLFRKK